MRRPTCIRKAGGWDRLGARFLRDEMPRAPASLFRASSRDFPGRDNPCPLREAAGGSRPKKCGRPIPRTGGRWKKPPG